MKFSKKLAAIATVFAVLSAAGIAGATYSSLVRERGAGPRAALVNCPGGMDRLGHELSEDMTLFAFDPAVEIEDVYTVANDFFLVEEVHLGAHAGTHLDVPAHFIEGGRTVDELAADEFVWPVHKIDVRGTDLAGTQLTIADIRQYERDNGRIKPGSLVVLQTGAEEFWGAEDVIIDEDGLSANVDDFFDFENAGFAGATVQWLFDNRSIDGVGSDAYGPDAFDDANFDATYTTLANDGVALVALANLDTVSARGDVIMAPTVALRDGSGFSTDPIACHRGSLGHDDDRDD